MSKELLISSTAVLPTSYGKFSCFVVKEKESNQEHFVIHKGVIKETDCLVRIHSECLTGEVFSSQKCDCGNQLEQSLQMISKDGGILIYLRQEGRGIGLFNKIEAYKLQETGLDTVDANLQLGLPADDRSYAIAAKVLEQLAPRSIKLITNNPQKIKALQEMLKLPIERVNMHSEVNLFNQKYLKTKATKLKHLINTK